METSSQFSSVLPSAIINHQSHRGPAVETAEEVLQPAFPGKYPNLVDQYLPDHFPVSSSIPAIVASYSRRLMSVSVHPEPIPLVSDATLHRVHEASSAPGCLSSASCRTLGRTALSIMEAPEPSDTVEISQPANISRPGPVCGSGEGVFQLTTSGKYALSPNDSIADAFTDSSSSPPGQSQPFAPNGVAADPSRAVELVTPSVAPNQMVNLPTSIYYQNVRGLRTKTTQLRLALLSCDYDILVLTETWLHSDIGNSEFSSGYTIFRCDRNASSSDFLRGGGVLIAVKNSFQCEPVSCAGCEHIEQVAVRIKLHDGWLFICAIYLPPNSGPELYSAHSSAIQQITDSMLDSDFILSLGDFNLPNLQWQLDEDINGYLPSNGSTEQELILVEATLSTGLQQINSLVNANGRLLDLAFFSSPDCHVLIEPPVPLLPVDTHHKPFVVLLSSINFTPTVFDDRIDDISFNFQRCNFDELNAALSAVCWQIPPDSSIDDALAVFYEKLLEVFHEHVPRKRSASPSSFKKPWWTAELRNLRNVLRKSRTRFFSSRSADDSDLLRDVETRYSALLVSTYQDYIARLESSAKHDPSSFWGLIKRQRSSNRIPSNVEYAGKSSCTNSEAADLFAEFFESVFTRVSPVPRGNRFQNIPPFNISIPIIQFSTDEVLHALENLDEKKGPGTDGLPSVLFKNCAAALASPITHVFNRSLALRKFPSVWKSAIIVPIHKSGSCNRVVNYRGVTLLCCLSKVLEHLVHKVLYNAALPIISASQHGFVKNRSTTTNLMCYVTEVTREVESKRQVDSIYIDFAKAFDTVPHFLIAEKLSHLGFPDWITKWLYSYLTDRSAFVSVNSARSCTFEISSGVPQGSVLGPLLFILFVNDLYQLLSSRNLSFADDLKFYRVISTVLDCTAMQTDIDAILEWCSDNGMLINSSKCKVISFTRCNGLIEHEYTIGRVPLDRVQTICDLGVTIDSKVKFNKHIAITTAKAWSVLGFIRRHSSDFTDIYALKTLFCALVRSILEYASPVWSPYHASQILRMERIQKQFVRYALRRLPWTDPSNLPSYPNRCELISLETLAARRLNLQRLFIFDLISGNIDCPALLGEIPLNVPPRRLRNSPFLSIPLHRTDYGHNSSFNACLIAFNDVSVCFDFNVSKVTFKNRIKSLV